MLVRKIFISTTAIVVGLNTLFLSFPLSSYQYELAACTMFQNEAPYLKEWLEFHKLVGIEHFYLYNNNSTDNYLEILQPYINNNQVTLINWPMVVPPGKGFGYAQCPAFMNGVKRTLGIVKWLACIDVDEYLFPTTGNNLTTVLKAYEPYGAVCVNWQMFGTSNVYDIPDDKLLIEALTLRAESQFQEHRHVKSIIRPERVHNCKCPHNFIFKPPYFQVNTNKQRFVGPFSPSILLDTIRINHYWCRDMRHFLERKLPMRARRGDNPAVYKEHAEKHYNKVEDTTILRFVPALRKQLQLEK